MFYTDLASPRAGIYIARECHKRGIPVVYNLQNPPSLDQGVTENVIEEMLGYTNLFITGKATICVTTGIENPTLAVEKFVGTHELSDGYICTQGSDGADWYAKEDYHCGICKVESIDTTGAGDAYIAGIIDSYYCKGKSKMDSMKEAATIAALKTLQPGPTFSYGQSAVRNCENEAFIGFSNTEKSTDKKPVSLSVPNGFLVSVC